MNSPRNRWRRSAIVGIPLVAALALSGCAAGGGADPDTVTDECPDGVITLNGISSSAGYPSDSQVAEFQETHSCVNVEIQRVPFDQLAETISVQASGSAPLDLIGYDGPWTKNLASQGVLLPLDDYVSEEWLDDVLESTLTEHSWEGALYSTGIQTSAMMMYYNKTMTDAAGIEVPQTLEDGWTWPEAYEAFQTCQQGPASSPTVWGLAGTRYGTGAINTALPILRSAGDPDAKEGSEAYNTYYAISEDGTTADGYLNTPSAIEAATFYQKMFNGDTAVSPQTPIPDSFLNQTACFDIDIPYLANDLNEANVDFEWGVTTVPYFTTPTVHTGSITIGVASKSKHADAAAEFVVAISEHDALMRYAEETNIVPVLNSVIDEMPAMHEFPLAVAVEQLREWGVPRPQTTGFFAYDQYVTDALADIAYGADPEDRLNQAVDQLADHLK
ncbi:extracellular solute-binding protein [Agromyces sp. GXQ0307]|uniref:extracellular solute-binding protein n=1 Tax=Agromyces sp. GXQ0307 TaxID=3377835 RepID=UPI00383A241F